MLSHMRQFTYSMGAEPNLLVSEILHSLCIHYIKFVYTLIIM